MITRTSRQQRMPRTWSLPMRRPISGSARCLHPAFLVGPDQEAIIQGYVDLLVRNLSSTLEQDDSKRVHVVDVLQWFSYTTFDIIGDLLWDSSFGCLEEVRYHPWIQVMAQFKVALIAGATKFNHPLNKIVIMATLESAMADLMQIWRPTGREIAQRLESGSERQDMISYMAKPRK